MGFAKVVLIDIFAFDGFFDFDAVANPTLPSESATVVIATIIAFDFETICNRLPSISEEIVANSSVCEIEGKARAMLTAERTAMNFVQLLSGVATKTRQFVNAIEGTRARIYDTRKTLPGLRIAQKYAVRAGGGQNHRIGLFDGILIKENHIVAAGGLRPAVEQALREVPENTMLQVEVETLEQLREALDCGAKLILLDNFDLAGMRKAVEIVGDRAELEGSGGVTLKTVRAIAETGVHRISVGALTKDVQAMDLSMRFMHH